MNRKILCTLALLLTVGNAAFAQQYRKIVSLAPSITKSLYALGVEERVTGITVYCPKGTTPKTYIGNILEPNTEKILELAPDLVIASKEGNDRKATERLMQLGVKVYVMNSYDNFDAICEDFVSLGRLVDRQAKAEELVKQAKARVGRVQKAVSGKKKLSVFWEVGAQPLFTVSRKTFVNDFIERAGARNICGDLGPRYPQISREEVVRRNPDVIIMVTMGDVSTKESEYWKKFREMNAVRNERIFVLGESMFTDPTPTAIAEGVEKVAKLLYGI